jgi:hypothetical protein
LPLCVIGVCWHTVVFTDRKSLHLTFAVQWG